MIYVHLFFVVLFSFVSINSSHSQVSFYKIVHFVAFFLPVFNCIILRLFKTFSEHYLPKADSRTNVVDDSLNGRRSDFKIVASDCPRICLVNGAWKLDQ